MTIQRIDPTHNMIANQFVTSFKNLSQAGSFSFSGNLLSPSSKFLLMACSVESPNLWETYHFLSLFQNESIVLQVEFCARPFLILQMLFHLLFFHKPIFNPLGLLNSPIFTVVFLFRARDIRVETFGHP